MKLSIIIPVYNVEKYLHTCLDSCLRQDVSPKSYEIIAVNDGSPDSCDQILKTYSSVYSNLKVITQMNSGLSVARNNGLIHAEGEYVWFVDSDDSIEGNCLSEIYKSLQTKPDMLQLNYRLTYEDLNIKPISGNVRLFDHVLTGPQTILNGGLPAPAQFTIYNRNFLLKHNLKFSPNRLHEDSEFKPRATYYAKSVKWHTRIVYNYLQRNSGSITSSFKLRNGIDLIFVNNSLLRFSEKEIKEDEIKQRFWQLIGLNFNTILYGMNQLSKNDRNSLISLLYKEKKLYQAMVKSKNLKYILEGLIFLASPKYGSKIYTMFKSK